MLIRIKCKHSTICLIDCWPNAPRGDGLACVLSKMAALKCQGCVLTRQEVQPWLSTSEDSLMTNAGHGWFGEEMDFNCCDPNTSTWGQVSISVHFQMGIRSDKGQIKCVQWVFITKNLLFYSNGIAPCNGLEAIWVLWFGCNSRFWDPEAVLEADKGLYLFIYHAHSLWFLWLIFPTFAIFPVMHIPDS